MTRLHGGSNLVAILNDNGEIVTLNNRLPVDIGGQVTIQNATIDQPQVGQTGLAAPTHASYTGVRAPDGTMVPLLAAADGRLLVDTGLVIPQPQTNALTDAQLRATPVPVATGLVTQTNALTDAQLRASAVPVTVGNFPATVDNRTLTERMFAKAPAAGYRLWVDITSTDAAVMYFAEAPVGSLPTDPVFRGVRMPMVNGAPNGLVGQAEGFIWNDRATVGWA